MSAISGFLNAIKIYLYMFKDLNLTPVYYIIDYLPLV